MKISEKLKSVLCNPEGIVCTAGSDEDRKILQEQLARLEEIESRNDELAANLKAMTIHEVTFVKSKLFSFYQDREVILPAVTFGGTHKDGKFTVKNVHVYLDHTEELTAFDIDDVEVLTPSFKVTF